MAQCSKARTLILAAGAALANHERAWRKGVHGQGRSILPALRWAADAEGKRVAVIGGGNSGVEAAIDLAGIVSHVTLLEFAEELRADAVLQKKLYSLPNVTVIKNAQTTEVTGKDKVSGLMYQDQASGETHWVELEGIFVQIGLLPNTDFLKGVVELTRLAK